MTTSFRTIVERPIGEENDVAAVLTGTIQKITGRGFGFIARDDLHESIFFYANEVEYPPFEELWVGHRVTFEVGSRHWGGDPRPRALRIRVVE